MAIHPNGRKDEARQLLAELEQQSKGRYVPPFWIAMIHVGLGEKDEAFAWLEKAYQEREWWLVWIKMDPKGGQLTLRFAFYRPAQLRWISTVNIDDA